MHALFATNVPSFPNPFRSLFPPARRRVTLLAALPLLVFFVAVGVVVFVCEARGILRFTWKSAFWLLLAAPWVWWLHFAGWGGLSGARAQLALAVRLALLALFAGALAEPRAVRKSDHLSIVYAVDVSDSMGEKVSDKSIAWMLETVGKKPPKDEAGLVVFGRDAAVELPPRQTFPFETINSRVARDGSDISKALGLASAMLPEGNEGRVVLISDGNETEGSSSQVVDELKSRGIAVDVVPVEFEFAKEVWLERLDLPRAVKQGEVFDATVLLSALSSGKGKLRVAENGQPVFEKEVEYTAGKNRFTLPLPQRGPGYYEYAATIEVPKGEDGWTENNLAMGDLYLKGEGKVLVITDARGDVREWEPLVAALKKAERVVQVRMSYETPRDPLSLLPYDLIIIPNAPADGFDALQMNAIHDAIYNQGSGFIMLGSRETFGPGGYNRSRLEEALPVSMDVTQKKVMPKGALALVLHTCEIPEGNRWAKDIAKAAIKVLGGEDEVGLLDFNTTRGDGWVFEMTPAKNYDAKLVQLINAASPQDMPAFHKILTMAHEGLMKTDAATRHCIIISDGDPQPPTDALLKQMLADKVSVSTVAINPHGGQTVSLMQAIANATGGRFYYPQDANELPAIFIKEAKTLKRSMLQNKTFNPTVEFPSPVLKGIDAMPPLHGYVITTPKPRASMILNAPPLAEELARGDSADPVLAMWRYGLGTTAAWTSDLAANWGKDWIGWEKYDAFVKQLVTETSRVETRSDLTLSTFAAGSKGIVTVEDFAKDDSFMEMKARVAGRDGQAVELSLKQVAPRRYQAEFPLWGKGRYQVAVSGVSLAAAGGKARNEQAVSGFSVPYGAEYLRFKSNATLLKQIAERTGGRVLSRNDVDIFQSARVPRESSKPVFDWFLIALACLVPIDVGVRRVQLDWSVVKSLFGFGKQRESTATMGALLERKKNVQATVAPVEKPKWTAPAPQSSVNIPKPVSVEPKPKTEKPPENPADAQSTTGRLLARKRKRDEGDGN
jgi:Ca-activated chloride channel homolog